MSQPTDFAKPADITSKWLHDHVYDHAASSLRMTLNTPFAVDSVYDNAEAVDVNPGGYQGMIVGGYTETSHVFTGLTFSEDNRLRVDAEITIQSVELEIETSALDGDTMGMYGFVDADSDQPTPLNLNEYGHLRTVPGFAGIDTILFNEESLDQSEELTVLTYVAPVNTKYHALRVSASGESDGVYRVKKNGNDIDCKRTSWANRNVDFNFNYGFTLSAGDSLEVVVTNMGDTTSLFNASMYGEEDV